MGADTCLSMTPVGDGQIALKHSARARRAAAWRELRAAMRGELGALRAREFATVATQTEDKPDGSFSPSPLWRKERREKRLSNATTAPPSPAASDSDDAVSVCSSAPGEDTTTPCTSASMRAEALPCALSPDVSAVPEEPPSAFSLRHVFPENARGRGVRTWLLPFLKDASRVVLQDPYVRSQSTRLAEVTNLIRDVDASISRVVRTVPWADDEQWAQGLDDPIAANWTVEATSKRRLHARWIKIWRRAGNQNVRHTVVTIDLDRGLDMYMRPSCTGESWSRSETLRARETVLAVRVEQAGMTYGDGGTRNSLGTTNQANRLASISKKRLRKLAQEIRRLVRKVATGDILDAAQRQKLKRRSAVELALARTARYEDGSDHGDADWRCPVPWCRELNRSWRVKCYHRARGCMGTRDSRAFDEEWKAACSLQHWWRCQRRRLQESWEAAKRARVEAVARAERVEEQNWRLRTLAVEEAMQVRANARAEVRGEVAKQLSAERDGAVAEARRKETDAKAETARVRQQASRLSRQLGEVAKMSADIPRKPVVCSFYGSITGCRWGDECRFVHAGSDSMSSGQSGSDDSGSEGSAQGSRAELAMAAAVVIESCSGGDAADSPRTPISEIEATRLQLEDGRQDRYEWETYEAEAYEAELKGIKLCPVCGEVGHQYHYANADGSWGEPAHNEGSSCSDSDCEVSWSDQASAQSCSQRCEARSRCTVDAMEGGLNIEDEYDADWCSEFVIPFRRELKLLHV